MTLDVMTDPERVWEVRLGVFCTAAQAGDLVDRIQDTLCPGPDHPPPCITPWTMSHWSLGDQEAAATYPELVDQVRIERRRAS